MISKYLLVNDIGYPGLFYGNAVLPFLPTLTIVIIQWILFHF